MHISEHAHDSAKPEHFEQVIFEFISWDAVSGPYFVFCAIKLLMVCSKTVELETGYDDVSTRISLGFSISVCHGQFLSSKLKP